MSENWIRDKCGCLHLRNQDLATRLVDGHKLMNADKKRFIQIFASPDYENATIAADTLV